MLLSKFKIQPTPKKEDNESFDLKDYLLSKLREDVINWLDKSKTEILKIVDSVVYNQIEKLIENNNKIVSKEIDKLRENELHNIKKGDKGDKPKAGIDYPIPKNGQDYILTEKDKKEIASKIQVPVVEKVIEKTEVIKEQPIITNEIKEVAKYEDAEKIISKINTMEQSILPEVIIGLKDWMQKVQKRFEKNGVKNNDRGGMGNWVHERFNISSATTSITLLSKIAAGGLAHIARYQGQVLDLDVDYSVNNNLITLLFTPDDSTVFTIAYIRT